ncbi:MAG: acetyltransferase [Paenibacillus sp.]|uniref:GNAT family N-acetyltransferase n=1 Tax=Paenibacillus sp. TaxID=58172 RepID=UPI0025FF4AD7|nr:GNAT family N-acetyltransferase [Paenibacillus sp.]MBR2566528.1 acetyltransferase [Paenibacillus sp.]
MTKVYQTEEITVRLLETKDETLLVKWLTDPEILQYYEGRDQPHDLELVRSHFYNQDDRASRCIVEHDGRPIGYIQFYELENEERAVYGYTDIDEDEVIYGTDQFIGETDCWNRGIGTRLVQSMIAYLIHERNARKIVMDPQAWNERALACYEKCGFRRIKRLPQHELHEGEMRDCWLMEYTP